MASKGVQESARYWEEAKVNKEEVLAKAYEDISAELEDAALTWLLAKESHQAEVVAAYELGRFQAEKRLWRHIELLLGLLYP